MQKGADWCRATYGTGPQRYALSAGSDSCYSDCFISQAVLTESAAMNFLDDPEREVLIHQILRADTLPEVYAAQAALRQWRQRYPED